MHQETVRGSVLGMSLKPLIAIAFTVYVGFAFCSARADEPRPSVDDATERLRAREAARAATKPAATQPQDQENAKLRNDVRRLQDQIAKLMEENAALRRQIAKSKTGAPPAAKESPKINWGLDLGTLTIDDAIKRFGKPVTRTSDGERKTKLTWKWYADGNPDVVVRTLWAQFDARGKIEDYEDTAK